MEGEKTMELDVEELRKALIDYYGTAMSSHPMAMMEVSNVERASERELVKMARRAGINIDNYME